jgi:hypothetical protein
VIVEYAFGGGGYYRENFARVIDRDYVVDECVLVLQKEYYYKILCSS